MTAHQSESERRARAEDAAVEAHHTRMQAREDARNDREDELAAAAHTGKVLHATPEDDGPPVGATGRKYPDSDYDW